jgi:hypothetical protein
MLRRAAWRALQKAHAVAEMLKAMKLHAAAKTLEGGTLRDDNGIRSGT